MMEEFVRVVKLKQGDILSRTIYSDDFKILLKQGNKLSSAGIKTIQGLGYKGCYIEHNEYQRREQIPLTEPVLDEKEKIFFISKIKESFNNTTPFTDVFDNTFKLQRQQLDRMVEDLVRHIIELYRDGKFLYENEDYTRTVNNWIYHHSLNTCIIAAGIALHMGIDYKTTKEIAIGALYHDFGKAFFGESLYNKHDLSADEEEQMRKHPEIMFRVLQRLRYPVNSSYAVWQHHETPDGKGYPKGLTIDKIILPAQIVSLASAFDSLVTMQSHENQPMKQVDALEYLNGCGLYSIKCMRALFEFIVPYPIGSKVKLSDGNTGFVLKNTKGVIMRPYVISDNKLYDLANDKTCRNITIIECISD